MQRRILRLLLRSRNTKGKLSVSWLLLLLAEQDLGH